MARQKASIEEVNPRIERTSQRLTISSPQLARRNSESRSRRIRKSKKNG